MSKEPLVITSRTDWTPALIERVYEEIEKIAYEEMDLEGKVYPNQIEIISSEQMIDAYASIGLPVHYNHWSFGKEFMKTFRAYEKGRQGLAYEIVINSSPCISYLMEDNTMMMQALVIAHAAFGHNAVFKNNECFKQWTNAGSIIDYMIFARDFIRKCEDRYGPEEVELVLDAAHALAPHGVDKFKRKSKPKLSEEARLKMLMAEEEQRQRELDIILKKTSFRDTELDHLKDDEAYEEEEENILYYIMKRSPSLEQWKREILRIVYKINQYFYPQSQTQNLNEGFASFTHYYIMTRLEEKGILSPDAYIAFLESHSGVLYQPEYNKRWYSGLNPYALGFAILNDLKRICENPTDEDREWFPNLIGRRWQEVVQEAAFEHRDDSFIMQYLSPKVIRDLKLFSVSIDFDNDKRPAFVSEIHDEVGYKQIRINLARSYERINRVPQIVVKGADLDGDRTLYLEYLPYSGRGLDRASALQVADYIDMLWGYPVELDDKSDDE
jgi:stage V sporulation protein R